MKSFTQASLILEPCPAHTCICRSILALKKGPFRALVMAKTKAMCLQGGGASSRGSTSSKDGSPKSVVGNFSLQSLPSRWDDTPAIRDRMRNGDSLIYRFDPLLGKSEPAPAVEASLENLKLNHAVLLPVLELMAKNELMLPSIENLIAAIEDFFILCKKTVRQPDHVYQEAWSIRRMIGRAKKFTYRSLPPQD